MRATFKHIRPDKETRDKENTLITVLYIMVAFGLCYLILNKVLDIKLIYLVIFLLIAYSSKLIRRLYKDWVFKKDIIGLIHFDSDTIVTDKEPVEIKTSEIKEIKLTFNYIKGKKYHSRDIVHNGLAKIQINTNDISESDFVFLIENKSQLDDLSKILKDYYGKQIMITEYLGKHNVKTFLLKPKTDWKFDDIQKIKSELRIETI